MDRLRDDGHAVSYITEMNPGLPDHEVLGIANGSGAVLITGDADFGDLIVRQRLINKGAVLIRLGALSPEHKARIVGEAIRQHAEELTDNFVVISPGAFRMRRSTS